MKYALPTNIYCTKIILFEEEDQSPQRCCMGNVMERSNVKQYVLFYIRVCKYTGSGHLDRKILICDTVGNFVQELTPFLRKIRCGECTVDFQTVPKWSNISLDDNVFDNSALCLAYLYARHENVCASQHGPSLSRHFGGPRGLYRISRRLER